MTTKTYNILFVCTGNSARSVMSEALATILGKGRFVGYSAGSRPTGRVNPFAVEQIVALAPDYPVAGLRSKSWDEFAQPGTPHMDFIVTVCDNAAGETCPYWPGHPATAHWGYPDPHERDDFARVFGQIRKRMEAFVALPIEDMDDAAIRAAVQRIGDMPV